MNKVPDWAAKAKLELKALEMILEILHPFDDEAKDKIIDFVYMVQTEEKLAKDRNE